MKNIKHKIRIISLIIFLVSILLFAIGFFIRNIPENPAYSYIDNKIVIHSWHDLYEDIIAVITLIMILLTVIEWIMLIVDNIKNKEKIFGNILFISFAFIFSYAAIRFNNLFVIGLWSDNDYDPRYYEFTDNQHTIVIKEESYLLYGGGTIYQIKDNNEAVVIGNFTTDDGGRNNGNYEIKWSEKGAEITYNTFNLENSKAVEIVTFE